MFYSSSVTAIRLNHLGPFTIFTTDKNELKEVLNIQDKVIETELQLEEC